jgi:hypothetical protein
MQEADEHNPKLLETLINNALSESLELIKNNDLQRLEK